MPRRAVRVCARVRDPLLTSGRANRWNDEGQHVLYLAEHFGTAVLESVVHANAAPPPPSHAAWATIPDEVDVETVDIATLPSGWDDADDQAVARAVGATWYREGRTACLIVPSVPGRPFELNVVVNARHVDAQRIVWEPVVDVPWDPRLF